MLHEKQTIISRTRSAEAPYCSKTCFALYGLDVDDSSENLVRLTVLEHFKIHLWYGFYFKNVYETVDDQDFKQKIMDMMYGNIWSAQRIIAKHHMTLD